jgi:hypothetical protein
MATIITKNSQTASAVPAASSLEVGELAVNTADGKLYTEHTGGVVKEIIPSTVVDGGITADKIASNAVTTAKIADSNVTEAKIADGAVTTNKLSSTGVTAGTYTTATVTVDAKGRITSASSGSGGGVSSLNGQTGAIVDTNYGAIGGYVIGNVTTNTEQGMNINSTYSGSSIVSSTSGGNNVGIGSIRADKVGGLGLSGTWRSLNFVRNGQPSKSGTAIWMGLLVRIS